MLNNANEILWMSLVAKDKDGKLDSDLVYSTTLVIKPFTNGLMNSVDKAVCDGERSVARCQDKHSVLLTTQLA